MDVFDSPCFTVAHDLRAERLDMTNATGVHGGKCFHDYAIDRVVLETARGQFVVLGSDGKFHVVHRDCVQGRQPEIRLS